MKVIHNIYTFCTSQQKKQYKELALNNNHSLIILIN